MGVPERVAVAGSKVMPEGIEPLNAKVSPGVVLEAEMGLPLNWKKSIREME